MGTDREPIDWAALVAEIRAGDEAATERCYRMFRRGIRFILWRQLGDQDLEDKVHDTFLAVVNAIRYGELREPMALMSFARTVVRREIAAYIGEAVRTRQRTALADDPVRTAVEPQPNPHELCELKERAELVQYALSRLSARDREILTRFYLLEESSHAIAADMGLTETQFRLLKWRAKAKFGEIGKRKLKIPLPKAA